MISKKISLLTAIIISLSILTACNNNTTSETSTIQESSSKDAAIESIAQESSSAKIASESTTQVSSSAVPENMNIDINIIEKNETLTVSEPAAIVDIVEKSLKSNSALLNLILTADQVEEYKSNGFYARIDYIDNKEILIETNTTAAKVKSIIILSDTDHGAIALVICDDYQQIFSIYDNIVSDIKSIV